MYRKNIHHIDEKTSNVLLSFYINLGHSSQIFMKIYPPNTFYQVNVHDMYLTNFYLILEKFQLPVSRVVFCLQKHLILGCFHN